MPVPRTIVAAVLAFSVCVAAAADGLIVLKSPYPAKVTMDRLEDLARERGLNVFARIDHAAGAANVGRSLRPTELLVFGNPKAGTPFMECAQTVGIDLPLKALVWEDAQGQVWLGYNDPAFIARRHDVASCQAAVNIGKALASLIEAALAE